MEECAHCEREWEMLSVYILGGAEGRKAVEENIDTEDLKSAISCIGAVSLLWWGIATFPIVPDI